MNIRNLNVLDNKWNNLKLSEKLFCLAVDANKVGFQIPFISVFSRTLNGAIIFELIDSGLLVTDEDVSIQVKSAPVYDRVHEFCLKFIHERKHSINPGKYFFQLCLHNNSIQRLIRRDLVRKNVINVKKKNVLFYSKRRISFQKTITISNIHDEIAQILSPDPNITSENLVLAALASKMGIISNKKIQTDIQLYLKNIPQERIPLHVQEILHLVH
jgi:hypothetical protein